MKYPFIAGKFRIAYSVQGMEEYPEEQFSALYTNACPVYKPAVSHTAISSCSPVATPMPTSPVAVYSQAHTLRKQHNINAVAFSPDGTLVASGGDDQTTRIWNVHTGKTQNLWKMQGSVVSLAFSPDSKLLAIAGSDGRIRLWDIHSVQGPPGLIIHSDVSSLAFAPDGKTLAGAEGQMAKIWNVATGKLEQSYWEASNGIRSVAYSPDGTKIATGGGDLKTWKVQTETLKWHHEQPAFTLQELKEVQKQSLLIERGTCAVASVTFSPDGKVVASASNNTIGLWNVATGELLRSLRERGDVEAVAFSSEGKIIAAAGQDGTIRLWQAETGLLMRKWQAKPGSVKCIAFSPKEPLLVSGGGNGTVLLWDATTGTLKKVLYEQ